MSSRRDSTSFNISAPREADIHLTKLLAKLGLLEPSLAERALSFPEYSPIAHFSQLGYFDQDEAVSLVAQHLKTETFQSSPADQDRIAKLLEKEPIANIALSIWKKTRAVPISLSNTEVVIAMANPLDLNGLRELERDLQRRTRAVVGYEADIVMLLSRTIELKDALDFNEFLTDTHSANSQSPITESSNESNLTNEDISAPSVVRLVNKILAGAILKGASDVHISPDNRGVKVRVRIDGIMRDLMEIPEGYKNAVISRIKVLCGMDITERRQPQDARLRLKSTQGVRDLRISTVPTVHGENLVARILTTDLGRVKLDKLGMVEPNLSRFRKVLRSTSKINLICGPTGSGKTSTLYAAILDLKDGTQHIITIEDPIENKIVGVNQIQVSPKIGLTFAKALRSVLRQDPDIIMVGEIRDSETASTAIQVAQTGHVVLSTLHTNTAAGAITRMRDLGVPSFMIASSVGSVLAQRLVRVLCENCKRELNAAEVDQLSNLGISVTNARISEGCDSCDKSGYRGRAGMFSFLEITPDIAAAIREEKGEDTIEGLAKRGAFRTLEESAIELIESGRTSLFEAERVLGPINAQRQIVIADSASQSQSGISKRRVLVVDDDETIRTVYRLLLEKQMFEVEEASNGIEGLDAIYRNPPALVLLDLMMPKMSGLEMVEKLKSDSRTQGIPILLLTAAANEENELKLLRQGADDFVSKTASSEILLARVSKLMNR